MADQVIVQQQVQQVIAQQQTSVVTSVSSGPQVIAQQQTNVVTSVASGPQGPPGPQGPAGSSGGGVGGGNFAFEQQTNSNTWTINHNLGYRPAILAIDYGGNIIEGDIVHVNVNTVTLNFVSSETGYAYLS